MKKNKKGFTLVELLAVIVVLATIMILAVPAVVDSMNNAKASSFALFGQRVLNEATARSESEALTSTDGVGPNCYCITGGKAVAASGGNPALTAYEFMKSTGTYVGKVELVGNKWVVTLVDKDYYAYQMDYASLNQFKSKGPKTGVDTASTDYPTGTTKVAGHVYYAKDDDSEAGDKFSCSVIVGDKTVTQGCN